MPLFLYIRAVDAIFLDRWAMDAMFLDSWAMDAIFLIRRAYSCHDRPGYGCHILG